MIGDRIRHARIAAGMTLDEVRLALAEGGLPITKAGLSKYELNKSVPKASTLLALGTVLRVPVQYFLEEPTVTVEWLAFRKHAALAKGRQERIALFAGDVASRYVELQHALYPDVIPKFPRLRHVDSLEGAEAAAQDARTTWDLGRAPIESVTQILEDQGVIVVGWSDESGQFDGLSGWVNKTTPIAVVNTAVPDDRRRYNLAHELGHMVMMRNGHSPDQEEQLAHRFAAAFLVPASVARQELGAKRRRVSMEELGILKRKYGLSMQAWARRATDLDIIDEGHYSSLCREFSRRGWRKSEPVSFEGHEQPVRLQQLVLHALAEGIISETQASRICPDVTRDSTSSRGHEVGSMCVSDLLRLSLEERSRLLEAAATAAEPEYRDNPTLTAFDALGDSDLFDEYGSD